MRDKDWVQHEDVMLVSTGTMGRNSIHPCQFIVRCQHCTAQVGPLHESKHSAQRWLWDNRRKQEQVFGKTLCDHCVANLLKHLEEPAK